jgi:rhodanese-related sulfurtransferase
MADVNVVNVVKFVTEWPNYLYIATALVSGGMLIWPAVRRGTSGSAVSPHDATLMINRHDALVLDVRSAEEFGKGHVLNARNVPLAQLEGRAGELQKHKAKPVIVCEDGVRSSAAAALRKIGFEKVYTLSGGLAAWQQAGLPVEK